MRTAAQATTLLVLSFTLFLATNASGNLCRPTPGMSSGTHFKPVTQQQVNIGSGFQINGKVLSAKDCKPIAGARVAHWQAGENGQYQDRLRAYLFSHTDGSFNFETEWPAARIPHIHFRVSADGYKQVSTQWIGDERVDNITFNVILQPE